MQRWTRSVNIFALDFLLVPINKDLHWSLAVVCFPGELLRHRIEGPSGHPSASSSIARRNGRSKESETGDAKEFNGDDEPAHTKYPDAAHTEYPDAGVDGFMAFSASGQGSFTESAGEDSEAEDQVVGLIEGGGGRKGGSRDYEDSDYTSEDDDAGYTDLMQGAPKEKKGKALAVMAAKRKSSESAQTEAAIEIVDSEERKPAPPVRTAAVSGPQWLDRKSRNIPEPDKLIVGPSYGRQAQPEMHEEHVEAELELALALSQTEAGTEIFDTNLTKSIADPNEKDRARRPRGNSESQLVANSTESMSSSSAYAPTVHEVEDLDADPESTSQTFASAGEEPMQSYPCILFLDSLNVNILLNFYMTGFIMLLSVLRRTTQKQLVSSSASTSTASSKPANARWY